MTTTTTLADLQATLQDTTAFIDLNRYFALSHAFLTVLEQTQPTKIISPTHSNYLFFQYGKDYSHRITRPLNSHLFFLSAAEFKTAFERFVTFLDDLKKYQQAVVNQEAKQSYLASNEINKVIYTIQQAAGSVADSFTNSNQARKRAGQLFEHLIKLIIQGVGLECESRSVKLPIPGYPGYKMPYELDLVISRKKAILASETQQLAAELTSIDPIRPDEIVGSVKTTSKDRIDKIFLDKYLLTKLLGRDIPVIAIFLHDVQRAQSKTAKSGTSIFSIHSTFKSNHFLGYTVALNKLDGVYYIDPRPEMSKNERLREQIKGFQQFLVNDLWTLSPDLE